MSLCNQLVKVSMKTTIAVSLTCLGKVLDNIAEQPDTVINFSICS